MNPDNINPLVATGRYPIAGKFGQPNDLFDMLSPIRGERVTEEDGYLFAEEPEFSFEFRQMFGV